MPATDAPVTIEEAIEAVNAATGGDKAKVRDFVKKLRSDSPDVANYLITSGKNQRDGEVQGDLKKLTDRIAELEGELETSHSELTTLRSKTPDVAAVEESAKRKYEKQLRKAEQDRDEAQRRFDDAMVQIGVDKAVALLIVPNEQGNRAHPQYAKQLAALELRKQFVPGPNGLAVKQIGEETEYDGDTLDAKVAALVKDFRAYIPQEFIVSNADSGAGVRNGTGGSGVAPGLKTQEQIIQAKRSNPAFSGI